MFWAARSYVPQANVNTSLELILTIPPRGGNQYYHLQFSGEETETEILKDLTQDHSARKGQSQIKTWYSGSQAWVPTHCTMLLVYGPPKKKEGGSPFSWAINTVMLGFFFFPSAPYVWEQRLPSIGDLVTLLGLGKLVCMRDILRGLQKTWIQASDWSTGDVQAAFSRGMDADVAPRPGAGRAACKKMVCKLTLTC